MKKHIIIPAIAALLSGCIADPVPVRYSPLIIDGRIDSGEPPVVIVTTNVSVGENEIRKEDLKNIIVTEAAVRIVRGTDTSALKGMTDTRYLPPYVYTTDEFVGVPGEKYELIVEYGKFRASSSTVIPFPAEISGASVEVSEKTDSLFTLYVDFRDNPETKDYYKFFTKVEGKDSVFYPSFLSQIDDRILDGDAHVPVSKGFSPLTNYKQLRFRKGDRVQVKLCTMGKEAYEFWKSYDAILGLNSNAFFPVFSNIESNIRGGFGIWAGYGAVRQEIVVE